ncbi:MAG TPA: hypothetical protein VEY71_06970 [Chitinophagales bacterium]|nr:hypothetical protein [Chitinophagales bacterium]
MALLDRLHFVSTPLVEHESEFELILCSRRKPVWNPVFIVGTVLFVASMFLKANVNEKWAAIPLGIAAIILLSGVWLLSQNGKLVFSRDELKVYRIYKHLGYVQRIYVTPLQSVDKATLFETKNPGLHLQLDNLNTILICRKAELGGSGAELVKRINAFLAD